MGIVTGPIRRGDGITPALALVDPKFPHNVGAAVRAASCYGVRQVWFSGDRVQRYSRPRMRKPRCWFYGDLADRFQGGRWPRVERVICDGFDGRQLIRGLSARW